MLKPMRIFACLLLACSLSSAQTISFGLDAGIPLNDLASALPGQVAATQRYTVGPAIQVGLTRRFALDVGFLYKRLDLGLRTEGTRAAVHRWELPLLARYEFSGRRLRPFVHAGVSFNRVFEISGAHVCARNGNEEVYCIGGETLANLRHRGTKGAVAGGGLESRFGATRLSAELRLTHWADRNFGVRDSSLRSNLTQLEILVGVRL